MRGVALGLILLVPATASATDFGIRVVGGETSPAEAAESYVALPELLAVSGSRKAYKSSFNLPEVKGIGAQFGRVTSTFRTKARNRLVGGVPNSWHLSGRAVDIARAPGVSHSEIAAAYRAAGYKLIESLDEGDHSHFAFSTSSGARPGFAKVIGNAESKSSQALTFRAVSSGSGLSR